MKLKKSSKVLAIMCALALIAGVSVIPIYAEDADYVTQRIYVDKTVKLSGSDIEVDGEYITLNWNTTGILSFDLGYTGNISGVRLGLAKWYGENSAYGYVINSASYENYKMNDADFDTWNNFVPMQNSSEYVLASTQAALNNYDEIDITDFATGINDSRYLSVRLKNAGPASQSLFWSKSALAFQPYIELTRDITKDAEDFVDAVNSASDEIGVEMAIDNYAQSTGLDYERYGMIDYCDVFAKELVGNNYADFSSLKSDFDALLEKYVPQTEIQCNLFAGFSAGEFNCLGKSTDSRTVKEANSCTVVFGYDTKTINMETLKGVRVRFKQATNNTSPYKMGMMLKYKLSDTYPELKYGGRDSDVHREWTSFLSDETAINKKIDIGESAGDEFYADLTAELLDQLKSNAGKELILHGTIPTGEKNQRNNFNLYMDSSIIVYEDISASYAMLQNILDGVATADEIEEWIDTYGANYSIDKNALYDMNGVYSELEGKTFADTQALCDEFERIVEGYYVVKYIPSSADVLRPDGGGGYTFKKSNLVVGNGNGWNMVINSFAIPAGSYVKDIDYVVTYGYTYEKDKNIQFKTYSTSNIPPIPDCEVTGNGTKYENGTTEYDSWKQYFSSMKSLALTYTVEETVGVGDTQEIKLSEEMINAVKDGAEQLNIAVSGSGNLQMYSAYNTSGKTPSQLKVTYDKTVFGTGLLEEINSAENYGDVVSALDEYGLALEMYDMYNALCDNAKVLLAKEVFGKTYSSVSEVDAEIFDFIEIYGDTQYVIKNAEDNNGTVSATIVNVVGGEDTPVLFAAFYNNNTLESIVHYTGSQMPTQPYTDAECEIGSYNGTYDSIKVFILKSFDLLQPLAKSYSIQ